MDNYDIIITDPDQLWDARQRQGKGRESKTTGWRRSFHHPDFRAAEAKRVASRLERALELYGTRVPRNGGQLAPESTLVRRASECAYTNPASPLYLHQHFMRALEPVTAERETRKITVIDRDWITDLGRFELDAEEIRDRVCYALRHCHGIFAVEFAINRGTRRDLDDWEVRFHIEGLCWGLETNRQRRDVSHAFATGLSGIPSVVRKPVYDLPGAVAYMLKHPYSVYSEYPGPGKSKIRTVRDQPYGVMAKVWRRFRMTDWTDMLFAVNDGRRVRDTLMASIQTIRLGSRAAMAE